MSFVSAKQVYTPDLLIPGRKPVGAVEIDWNKAITRDLKFCFYPTDRNLRDLVSGNGPNAIVLQTPDNWDIALRSNSQPSFIPSSGLAFHAITYASIGIRYRVKGVDPTKGITLAYFYVGDYSHIYDRGWGIGNTAGDYLVQYSHATSNYRWSSSGFEGGANYSLSPSKVSGASVLAGIRSNYSETIDAAYGSQEGTLGTFTAAGGINEIWFGLSNRTTRDTAPGSYYLAAFWNRKLTSREWQSLRKNPFQFIKPVGSKYLNVGVAEVVGGDEVGALINSGLVNAGLVNRGLAG